MTVLRLAFPSCKLRFARMSNTKLNLYKERVEGIRQSWPFFKTIHILIIKRFAEIVYTVTSGRQQ